MKRSTEFDIGLQVEIKRLKEIVVKTNSDETSFVIGIYNAVQERGLEFATIQILTLLGWVDILVNSLLDERSLKELEKHRQEDESWEESFQTIVCRSFVSILDTHLGEMAARN